MGQRQSRYPVLATHYHRYLSDGDAARFITDVTASYTIGTLERLAEHGPRYARRAGTLALGFISDFRSNAVLGRRLQDRDRGVRMLAANGICELWCRDGTARDRSALGAIMRFNSAGQFAMSRQNSTQLIDDVPGFAEAWNQRAVALFYLREFRAAAGDCRQALELNPYHFGAAVGMGQCYLELNDPRTALECFRRALKLHPGLENVRAQIARLQRALEGHRD